jgi:hypothetical protein
VYDAPVSFCVQTFIAISEVKDTGESFCVRYVHVQQVSGMYSYFLPLMSQFFPHFWQRAFVIVLWPFVTIITINAIHPMTGMNSKSHLAPDFFSFII